MLVTMECYYSDVRETSLCGLSTYSLILCTEVYGLRRDRANSIGTIQYLRARTRDTYMLDRWTDDRLPDSSWYLVVATLTRKSVDLQTTKAHCWGAVSKTHYKVHLV